LSQALKTPFPLYLPASQSLNSNASCEPVEAPLGTIARPEDFSDTTRTSTVGFPLESSTSCALIDLIFDIFLSLISLHNLIWKQQIYNHKKIKYDLCDFILWLLKHFIMEFIWHGYSCFTIRTGKANVVINPYNDGEGLKLPSLKADLVILTGNSANNNNQQAVSGEKKVIDWPGEYEIREVAVTAKKSPVNEGIYLTIAADNLKICYIENIGKEISSDLLEFIGDIDVLLISVGGGEEMDAQTAHKIIEELEPRCVIPMNYAVEGSTSALTGVDQFIKLVGANVAEAKEKLTLQSRSALKEDVMEVVILKPQL